MGFFLIMKAEVVRSWIVMRRYWFRTVTSLFLSYGMMMILVLGFLFSQDGGTEDEGATPPEAVQVEANPEETNSEKEPPAGMFGLMAEDSEKATNYILGFIIGVFAFGVVGMFTQGLQGMARTGVLEQLCMSPHGLIVNFLARAAVGSVTTVVSSSIMVWLVTFTLGGSLHFTAVPVFVLLILTFANLLGFGFMVGGLVLVFKQVGQVAIIVRLVLFLIAVTASEELLNKGWALAGIMHALPVTDAAICIKAVLIDDLGYGIFQHNSFYWLMASCVVWTSLGLVTFKFMENWSRSKGTLGAY